MESPAWLAAEGSWALLKETSYGSYCVEQVNCLGFTLMTAQLFLSYWTFAISGILFTKVQLTAGLWLLEWL